MIPHTQIGTSYLNAPDIYFSIAEANMFYTSNLIWNLVCLLKVFSFLLHIKFCKHMPLVLIFSRIYEVYRKVPVLLVL
jgi:hypothetical protein